MSIYELIKELAWVGFFCYISFLIHDYAKARLSLFGAEPFWLRRTDTDDKE